MGADQEVCQNAAGARVSLFPSTCSVTLEGSARCPPDRFIQGPVNADTGFSEERIQERFTAARGSHQLSAQSALDAALGRGTLVTTATVFVCDGHSKDSREAKLRAREIQLNKHRVRNIGRVRCYFD